MPGPLNNHIASAIADPQTHTVRLTWRNGAITTAQFGRLVGQGVFEAFRDPAFFAKVDIRRNGRVLTWPGELDFCADALWFEAHPEDRPVGENRCLDEATGSRPAHP
jgi:Protein of unknown function (DUF2442)